MISIITPVYNGEKFIETCIQVVIDQNCTDVEHIIVDGGSKDHTVNIIKQYAEKYPHIRWISEKDKGQSDAMNKGIAMAKGEILSILNVDDYYEPNVLNKVSEIFKSLPEPSFLVGNCNIWDENNSLVLINKPKNMKLKDLLKGWKINPIPANPSAYFYHTSIHKKIGLYNIEEHYGMDLDFILRVVQAAHVKYIDETLGNFRLHNETKTFNSIATGETKSETKRILRKYRKKLPLLQQWQIAIRYDFLDEVEDKISYFSKNPQKIISKIQGKFTKIFSSISAT
ncbi:glycosyltransferase [Tolypothrix sp. PCC 7910]|uniref:glycosyltransferase family 2 protein n=1 Tax=Tolypothrix sp. PCC 7910 TaxID=2099387 RepID=UPI0014277B9B|nr:glycosyltransferase family 2 protein [Tolypothrix sp. PCC 7910]QIR37808.1 glycosyltransferase [Tolypothrix sp. PCC 7910]